MAYVDRALSLDNLVKDEYGNWLCASQHYTSLLQVHMHYIMNIHLSEKK